MSRFVSLDPAMAARAQAMLLEAWRARPTAALLVTHDRAEAAALADRVLVLAGSPRGSSRRSWWPGRRAIRMSSDDHRKSGFA